MRPSVALFAHCLLPGRLGECLGPARLTFHQDRQDYEICWDTTETLVLDGRPLYADRTMRLFLTAVDFSYSGIPTPCTEREAEAGGSAYDRPNKWAIAKNSPGGMSRCRACLSVAACHPSMLYPAAVHAHHSVTCDERSWRQISVAPGRAQDAE